MSDSPRMLMTSGSMMLSAHIVPTHNLVWGKSPFVCECARTGVAHACMRSRVCYKQTTMHLPPFWVQGQNDLGTPRTIGVP